MHAKRKLWRLYHVSTVSQQEEERLVVFDPWSTFAGPLGYYFRLTVPNGSSKEALEAVFKAKWAELGLSTDGVYCTGLCLTFQRKYAQETRELTKTTADVFSYGCNNIMPCQAVALGKAMGSFEYITRKRCIMDEPEVEWFKWQLFGNKSCVLLPRQEEWVQDSMEPYEEDEEALEEWMEKTYPCGLPFVYVFVVREPTCSPGRNLALKSASKPVSSDRCLGTGRTHCQPVCAPKINYFY